MAHFLKSELFSFYYNKEKDFQSWVNIFDKLPVGMIVIDKESKMRCNEAINDIFQISHSITDVVSVIFIIL